MSFSLAVLAMLIKRFIDIAIRTDQISGAEAGILWKESLDLETIPRRFGS